MKNSLIAKLIIPILTIIFNGGAFAADLPEISVDELKRKIESSNEDFVVVDVRTPGEHDSGIIKGSMKKNLYSTDFDSFISKLDKKKTYLIYCRSGRRSANATRAFQKYDLKAFNVKGGINAWKDKGYPTH